MKEVKNLILNKALTIKNFNENSLKFSFNSCVYYTIFKYNYLLRGVGFIEVLRRPRRLRRPFKKIKN
jgi:hypothetical protein